MNQHNGDEIREQAELYALGGLEAAEKKLVEDRLQTDACRKALAQGGLAAYAVAASAAEMPPRGLRDRVLAVTRTTVQKVVPLRTQVWNRQSWLAAAAAAAVLIFAATWAFESSRVAHPWAAACAPATTQCTVTGRVVAVGASQLRLEAHGMSALPSGKVYQAWYIRAGAGPTPAPTFVPDARGEASVVIPVGAEKGLTVAVTVEPAGGQKRRPQNRSWSLRSIDR